MELAAGSGPTTCIRLTATLLFLSIPLPRHLSYFRGLVVACCGRGILRYTFKFKWGYLFVLLETEPWNRDNPIKTQRSAAALSDHWPECAFWHSGWKPHGLQCSTPLSGLAPCLTVWFEEVGCRREDICLSWEILTHDHILTGVEVYVHVLKWLSSVTDKQGVINDWNSSESGWLYSLNQ